MSPFALNVWGVLVVLLAFVAASCLARHCSRSSAQSERVGRRSENAVVCVGSALLIVLLPLYGGTLSVQLATQRHHAMSEQEVVDAPP